MAEAEEKKEQKKKRFSLRTLIIVLLILILVAIAGWSFFQYWQARQQIAKLSTLEGQQKLAQKEVDMLLNQVKKHMVLPDKEKPTVATVTDVNALKKNQPFFSSAQNGDKVIVYVQARKAIIYSPERDIIVNVGAVAVDETGSTQGVKTTASAVKIEMRNGTATAGAAREIANTLSGDKEYTVTAVTEASKKDYATTIVVDLGRSKNPEAVSALAQALNAQLTKQAPEGEKTSAADVLVIVGADQQ